MASQYDILQALAKEAGPLSRVELGERLGQPYRKFQNQLDRLKGKGFISDEGDHTYQITDAGRKELETPTDDADDPETIRDMLADEVKPLSDKEKFATLGLDAGMTNKGLLRGVVNLVSNRGNMRDLAWVWAGLEESNIDKDIGKRWLSFWAAHINVPMPAPLAKVISATGDPKVQEERRKALWTHDLDANDNPIYVGEGKGSMTHDEAFDLAQAKAAGKAKMGGGGGQKTESPGDALAVKAVDSVMARLDQPPPSVDPTSETQRFVAMFQMFKQLMGENGNGNQPRSTDEMTGLFNLFMTMIDKFGPKAALAAAPAAATKAYVVDNRTGTITETEPGKPMVITIRETAPAGPAGFQSTPIQMMDASGKPIILSLDTYFQLEDHKAKIKRDEESHQVKMDIAKSFKEALGKATTALEHTIGEKEG